MLLKCQASCLADNEAVCSEQTEKCENIVVRVTFRF